MRHQLWYRSLQHYNLQLFRRGAFFFFFVGCSIQQETRDITESKHQTTRIAMSPDFPLRHNYQPGNTLQKYLKTSVCFQAEMYIISPPRLTWHWGHMPLSFCFEQVHKSISHLLPTIKSALKFYYLFRMCNVMWFMWTQWVTPCNCGCFCGRCPHRDPLPPAARSLTAAFFQPQRKHSLIRDTLVPRKHGHVQELLQPVLCSTAQRQGSYYTISMWDCLARCRSLRKVSPLLNFIFLSQRRRLIAS